MVSEMGFHNQATYEDEESLISWERRGEDAWDASEYMYVGAEGGQQAQWHACHDGSVPKKHSTKKMMRHSELNFFETGLNLRGACKRQKLNWDRNIFNKSILVHWKLQRIIDRN